MKVSSGRRGSASLGTPPKVPHKLTGAVKSMFIGGHGIRGSKMKSWFIGVKGVGGFQCQVPVLSLQAPVRESATGVTSTIGFWTQSDWVAHMF